jgi:hypothetical protein
MEYILNSWKNNYQLDSVDYRNCQKLKLKIKSIMELEIDNYKEDLDNEFYTSLLINVLGFLEERLDNHHIYRHAFFHYEHLLPHLKRKKHFGKEQGTKIECSCGLLIAKAVLKRHQKTNKHFTTLEIRNRPPKYRYMGNGKFVKITK